jgi:hypothetical protein
MFEMQAQNDCALAVPVGERPEISGTDMKKEIVRRKTQAQRPGGLVKTSPPGTSSSGNAPGYSAGSSGRSARVT